MTQSSPADLEVHGLPDFKYVNQIPILDFAKENEFEMSDSGNIVCWHSQKHAKGHPVRGIPFLTLDRYSCSFPRNWLRNLLASFLGPKQNFPKKKARSSTVRFGSANQHYFSGLG